MKFSKEDKEKLRKQAWADAEIIKMEDSKVFCYICKKDKKRKTTDKRAREVLGDDVYLSGVARAVASKFSVRKVPKNTVLFLLQEN